MPHVTDSLSAPTPATDPTAPLNDDEREQLRDLIVTRGEVRLARELRVGRQTLARATAGLELRRGTVVLVREQLRRLAPAAGA